MPQWEPNAAPAEDRRHAWFDAQQAGIKTWCSVEPVLDPTGALAIIDRFIAIGTIDHWKLGKLSGYDAETKRIECSINWPSYREEARRILNAAGYREITEPGAFEVGTYYVKQEFREAL
jgi:DNA repair photolyase